MRFPVWCLAQNNPSEHCIARHRTFHLTIRRRFACVALLEALSFNFCGARAAPSQLLHRRNAVSVFSSLSLAGSVASSFGRDS
jgi:hypothetical protein